MKRMILVVAIVCLLVSPSLLALTDEERIQMLDDKLIKGQINEDDYERLLKEYRSEVKKGSETSNIPYYVWIECENPTRTNMIAEPRDKDIYSGDRRLRAPWKGDPQYANEKPAAGCYFAEYDLEIPEDGIYNIWFHGHSQMFSRRSRCGWSIDNGDMHDLAGRMSQPSCTDAKRKTPFWTNFGKVRISKGKHQFLIKAFPSQYYGRYVAWFDCIVFINTKYSTWKPDLTPEVDGIRKPPSKPSKEGLDIFSEVVDGGNGILEVDFSEVPKWSSVDILLQREERFDSIPKDFQVLLNNVPIRGVKEAYWSTKFWILLADATGEEFSVLLGCIGYPGRNGWKSLQINPAQLIEKTEFSAKEGNGDWAVDFPLKFKGIRIATREPKKEKIGLDNLVVGGRLVEDFEDIGDWKVTATVSKLKPAFYSTGSQEQRGWGRFFVQVDTIYLASDLTTWVPFEYDADIPYSPTHMRLQVDLPEGITIASKSHDLLWEGEETPAVKEQGKVKHGNDIYTRYRVVCKAPGTGTGWTKLAGYPPLDLYLKTNLKAGSRVKIFHKTIWQHGGKLEEDKEVAKNIEVFQVAETLPPKRFVTGVWAPEFAEDSSTPNDFYLKIGLANIYSCHPLTTPAMRKELRKLGYRKVTAQSVGGMRGKDKDSIDACCATIDGNKLLRKWEAQYTGMPQVTAPMHCPSYRGAKMQEHLEKTSELAKMDFDGLPIGFGEPGAGFLYLQGKKGEICFCDRCLKEYRKYLRGKYPSMKYISPREFEKDWKKYPEYHKTWWAFKTDMQTEMVKLYADRFKNEAQKAGRNISDLQIIYREGMLAYPVDRETGNYINSQTGYPYAWSVFIDYKKLSEFVNIFMDQIDRAYCLTLVGDNVRSRREMMGKNSRAKIVPVVAGRYSIYW